MVALAAHNNMQLIITQYAKHLNACGQFGLFAKPIVLSKMTNITKITVNDSFPLRVMLAIVMVEAICGHK